MTDFTPMVREGLANLLQEGRDEPGPEDVALWAAILAQAVDDGFIATDEDLTAHGAEPAAVRQSGRALFLEEGGALDQICDQVGWNPDAMRQGARGWASGAQLPNRAAIASLLRCNVADLTAPPSAVAAQAAYFQKFPDFRWVFLRAVMANCHWSVDAERVREWYGAAITNAALRRLSTIQITVPPGFLDWARSVPTAEALADQLRQQLADRAGYDKGAIAGEVLRVMLSWHSSGHGDRATLDRARTLIADRLGAGGRGLGKSTISEYFNEFRPTAHIHAAELCRPGLDLTRADQLRAFVGTAEQIKRTAFGVVLPRGKGRLLDKSTTINVALALGYTKIEMPEVPLLKLPPP